MLCDIMHGMMVGKEVLLVARMSVYMHRYTSFNTQKSVVEPRAYKITQGNKYK